VLVYAPDLSFPSWLGVALLLGVLGGRWLVVALRHLGHRLR
jgi:hypothetical protein